MNMREKIARSLYQSNYSGFIPSFDAMDKYEQSRWLNYADAALAALMEPTTGMQYAALPLVDRMHQTRDVFVSMIEAAKEGK